ncbi:TolC family protein [Allorhodopirellula solitaria]|uniref:Outer membrane efflux protein n=1 Tax=Allorhodopirellula solitaria TaxID=2527987 RepID=A0A5C5XXF9_9BACT|nr:TolC family protein [Allorhodopirellula solitaria]TWT67181.1 Outer membrane efflux protein [Allorhodopirellula solitaria]
MPRSLLTIALMGMVGCASNPALPDPFSFPAASPEPAAVTTAPEAEPAVATPEAEESSGPATAGRSVAPVSHVDEVPLTSNLSALGESTNAVAGTHSSHDEQNRAAIAAASEGVAEVATFEQVAIQHPGSGVVGEPVQEIVPAQLVQEPGLIVDEMMGPEIEVDAPSIDALSTDTIDLNLPSVLAMVGGQHPVVGLAQSRVREAYARLDRANVLWLPSIQSGFSFYRHDGNFQAVDGEIVDVNRNSFQYGLGTEAVGAGTYPRPGLVAQFHLADAIFQPEIAEKTAWARGHAASATFNEQLLRAALAYTELLDAHQDARILEESRQRAAEVAKITADFAAAGEGLQADADRMQTELSLIDNRLIASRERVSVASARLAQAISIDASNQILPMDVNAVPLDLVAAQTDKSSLIRTGLSTRPELKESQALVAAACDAYQREKYAPFVPSVLLGYSAGGFGGGLGNDLADVAGRYDFQAAMTWEVRNLGFGEKAARRESSARVEQAKFEKLRAMDQVAREVSEACSQIDFRRQQIAITQQAIQTAQDSYAANSERIRDGEGLPIEVLQAVQALESARRAYLSAVIAYNRAQFQLQWALGWPVHAPPTTAMITEM